MNTTASAPDNNPVNGRVPGAVITGTVSDFSGNTLTLTTQQGTSTVTISDNTVVQKMETGSSSDLVTGKFVEVSGTADSSGNIVASSITVNNHTNPSSPSGTAPAGSGTNGPMPTGTPPNGSPPAASQGTNHGSGPGLMGTISAVNGDTLTIDAMQGNVTVTINSSTTILKLVTDSSADISTGQSLIIRGSQDSSGNFIASNIVIQPQ